VSLAARLPLRSPAVEAVLPAAPPPRPSSGLGGQIEGRCWPDHAGVARLGQDILVNVNKPQKGGSSRFASVLKGMKKTKSTAMPSIASASTPIEPAPAPVGGRREDLEPESAMEERIPTVTHLGLTTARTVVEQLGKIPKKDPEKIQALELGRNGCARKLLQPRVRAAFDKADGKDFVVVEVAAFSPGKVTVTWVSRSELYIAPRLMFVLEPKARLRLRLKALARPGFYKQVIDGIEELRAKTLSADGGHDDMHAEVGFDQTKPAVGTAP